MFGSSTNPPECSGLYRNLELAFLATIQASEIMSRLSCYFCISLVLSLSKFGGKEQKFKKLATVEYGKEIEVVGAE